MVKWITRRYRLPASQDTVINLPHGSRVLSVTNIHEHCYVVVDEDTESNVYEPYKFVMVSGRYTYKHDDNYTYVGTVVMDEGFCTQNLFYTITNHIVGK